MQIHVHCVRVVTHRPANQLGRRISIIGGDELIYEHVRFEFGFHLVKFVQRDTDKSVYGRVCVFRIQRVYLALQVQGQAPKKAQIVVICRIAVVVFLQPDDGLIVLHVVRKVDTDATDRVMYDPVDEERDVGHEFTDPVRIWPLGNGPLQDV